MEERSIAIALADRSPFTTTHNYPVLLDISKNSSGVGILPAFEVLLEENSIGAIAPILGIIQSFATSDFRKD
ncbi:hypothetical protein ACE1CD_19575 [Aerosakkonema sp. BLCC-F183]|uniref:hypothetical protein n=1 Tax=Aerosakkonema sp. BLCC-F183 TaxID=3342834 RepID=UPI0035B72B80